MVHSVRQDPPRARRSRASGSARGPAIARNPRRRRFRRSRTDRPDRAALRACRPYRTVHRDRSRGATPRTEARPGSRLRASRDGHSRSRAGPPASAASAALGRTRSDRARAPRAPRSLSRDDRRELGRTCRQRRRSASLLLRAFPPLHLQSADANGVALLRSERPKLAFDATSREMALEIRRRFGAVPIDARREPLDAITLHAEGLALAGDMPVAGTAGEGDAALAGRGRRRSYLTRRAALEDESQQIIRPLARGGRDRDRLHSPYAK